MPKYGVEYYTTASSVVYVEADSPEDAIEKSFDASLPTLCHQCSGGFREDRPSLELGDWEPTDEEPWLDE